MRLRSLFLIRVADAVAMLLRMLVSVLSELKNVLGTHFNNITHDMHIFLLLKSR